ncbi:MAG: carotenoid oxygenase family protein, partial [Actinomycetota bacterium]|nr:carotenoid oxygenase family protein [Actinomycetota bacterium]
MSVAAASGTAAPEGWRLGFRSLDDEVPEWRRCTVEGDVPADLGGTIYFVGPGRHDVHGDRNGSFLDGDGMAHA